ncbi:hypothetical protein GF386_04020 [Candidatus Pacearchaeota archaeon]|nr:hypothetical protein [Candidatus Pacearchaeota archaeon]
METYQTRPGETITTSVSVTKGFMDKIKYYKLSPTEVFRRGLATTLADLGVYPYDNILNKKRLEVIKNYMRLQEIQDLINNLREITRKINLFIVNLEVMLPKGEPKDEKQREIKKDV